MTTQQENFISAVAPLAQEGWNKWKVLPSLTLAQAIIESNWGKSGLTKTANALFGIKANGWQWRVVNYKT
jgi:flagellum-specific peptidoglycan hydrolase FlgJ